MFLVSMHGVHSSRFTPAVLLGCHFTAKPPSPLIDGRTVCDDADDCPLDDQICCPVKGVCESPTDIDPTACGKKGSSTAYLSTRSVPASLDGSVTETSALFPTIAASTHSVQSLKCALGIHAYPRTRW